MFFIFVCASSEKRLPHIGNCMFSESWIFPRSRACSRIFVMWSEFSDGVFSICLVFTLRVLITCLILRIDSYSARYMCSQGLFLSRAALVGVCVKRRGFSFTKTRYSPALELLKCLCIARRGEGMSAGREKPG